MIVSCDEVIFIHLYSWLKKKPMEGKKKSLQLFLYWMHFETSPLSVAALYNSLSLFYFLFHLFHHTTWTGVSTALRMCYSGYGHPLTLFLEEGGVVTVCKINTQEPEEPIDFDFCSSNVTNKVDIYDFSRCRRHTQNVYLH